ncbi:YicC/YloC family endoribonuclease [Desulfuromonas acetoxidans]|uniref:YicC/YloC family endoribonuclease n=1 Tax=Desulfuromonas acetoxidans TaxID=891 RepID=UPI00292D9B10|nr:YicC/YloC family endoribonuclease [Desulfuromonas acetoxidans]
MIKSMTGYGKGQVGGSDAHYSVEIKTVNHRYADITVKVPRTLMFLERDLKKWTAERLTRGKIDVFVNRESTEQAVVTPVANDALATEYVHLFRAMSERYHLSGDIPLSLLVAQKDVVTLQETNLDEELVRDTLQQTLEKAIDAVETMRLKEGAALQEDIQERLSDMESLLQVIEERAPLVVDEWRQKLQQRLERLQSDVEPDPQRVAQEVAIFADRCDISEEVVRFKSHLVQFRQLFESEDAVGRQMDFLIQELNRETNTMGSKSNDAELTRQVVAIKAELEKIREQVQNIE